MNAHTLGVSGLASIIVPCWNQLEFTRQCIAALRQHTRQPWELLVVNNGSTDGTGDYLAGVQDGAAVPVTVITNATNLGFPAAINQGLQLARGEYLVLLNNDVVVTDAWLEQLIALSHAEIGATKNSESDERREDLTTNNTNRTEDKKDGQGESSGFELEATQRQSSGPQSKIQNLKSKIGMVGPMSNYAAPPQLVENVPYHTMREIDAFARRWRDEHRGQWFTVPKLSGFCILMKRAVYEAIGGLDERFGLGLFDDNDLAQRARRAGFELAVAYDLFVNHFGSRTFAGNRIDTERLLDENARKFAAKWADSAPRGRRIALAPWSPAAPGGATRGADCQSALLPRAHEHADNGPNTNAPVPRARVSLTMIVRDEYRNA